MMKSQPSQARHRTALLNTFVALCFVGLTGSTAVHAVVFVVPKAALTSPAVAANTIVHFDEVANNTPIHGQTIQ